MIEILIQTPYEMKLNLGAAIIDATDIVLDSEMSDYSVNAVQNKIIKEYIDNADTDNVLEIKNGSTNLTASITGEGVGKFYKIGVGNSASATTLGSVTKKIEIFDASGNSLGFIPVYDSIS